MMNDLTQVWFDHGGIKRSIAHFLYGIPRWKGKKVKPSTAKRVNLFTELRLQQQISKTIISAKFNSFIMNTSIVLPVQNYFVTIQHSLLKLSELHFHSLTFIK